MRPLTRVFAAAVLAGASTGVLALRPASATPSLTHPTESSVQAVAVADAQHVQATAAQAARAAAALRASRAVAAARHAAYLRSLAVQAAARRAAARAVVTAAPVRTAVVTAVPAVRRTETQVQRGQRVYAGLHYDVTRLGYTIRFLQGRADLLGMTDAGSRTVTVYVRRSMSDLVLSHTIAHELGHALDFSRGTAYRRSQYLGLRGLGTREWFGCSTCTDYATPAGDWAEVFAQWLAGPGDFRSQLGPAPTAAQRAQLAELFRLA